MVTRDEEGMLEVNKQYQEAMKIVINLVTASLVLPVVFVKNILGVEAIAIKGHVDSLAYWSWGFLLIALAACVGFYFCSTKFTKAVYQREQSIVLKLPMEMWRDLMALIAVPFFFAGLVFLLIFFVHELSIKTVMGGGV